MEGFFLSDIKDNASTFGEIEVIINDSAIFLLTSRIPEL
jgi:hypothetical protein